jgi:hypothetical protein
LEFDEEAPFLKASKAMAPDAWDKFRKEWRNPYGDKSSRQVLDTLRGEAKLPKTAAWLLLEDGRRYVGSARHSSEGTGL